MELIIENSYQNHEVFQFAEKELKGYWKKMQEKSDALQLPGSYRLRLELAAGEKAVMKRNNPRWLRMDM